MKRRRTLKPEEKELWQAVARTARPLHPVAAPLVAATEQSGGPAVDAARSLPTQKPVRLEQFQLGSASTRFETRNASCAPFSDKVKTSPVLMDRKAFAAMTRGKSTPEARIDLHGLTLAEAHPELVRFVLNAHSAGVRLVLVITGKGKARDDRGPIPARIGALRHQVPLWLGQMPLAPLVLQIAEAHARHGGSGAYYVFLRRNR